MCVACGENDTLLPPLDAGAALVAAAGAAGDAAAAGIGLLAWRVAKAALKDVGGFAAAAGAALAAAVAVAAPAPALFPAQRPPAPDLRLLLVDPPPLGGVALGLMG